MISSNAAIYLHPGGYDASGPELLGRLSAGESFLRGFIRHADVDQFHFWNAAAKPQAELEALVQRIEPPGKPVNWIRSTDRPGLEAAGVLSLPGPGLSTEALLRRPYGPRRYALCGLTHTTSTARVMQAISDILIGPADDHDALICTSEAVRRSVESQLDGVRDYLEAEFGPRRRPEPMRVTIPLGINTEDFATSPEARTAWRERLDIPDEAIVALFVGRFDMRGKMNPALMALALEKAARRTTRPIYWVNSGWSPSAEQEEAYHDRSRALCPSVGYRSVDGREPDVRFAIWSVADFFISFSDNIQETFGLTPVEAMAAGLPCVVTDWNGYKDTVRHGVDGFRVPTLAPAAGRGADLAYFFDSDWLSYNQYIGATGQFTAIDYEAATRFITVLVENKDLRDHMGQQAQARARAVFDWATVIRQYQALWAEQNARRLARPAEPPVTANPFRPDPFMLFQSYPTQHLSARFRVAVEPDLDWPQARERLESPIAAYSNFNRPSLAEAEQVYAWIRERPGAQVGELLKTIPQSRRFIVGRGLLWMARYGVLRLVPPADQRG